LAEKEKDKTSYKYADARQSLTDVVQLREGIADFAAKKAKPIQAIIDPLPIETTSPSEEEPTDAKK
jgi:hypothetical protein